MVTVSMATFYIFTWFLWLQVIRIYGDDSDPPVNFPPTIPIAQGDFLNWAGDIQVSDLWIATPADENDVLTMANWAAQNDFKLRASGFSHNWSPLTVTNGDNGNIVLVDTTSYLNNIQVPTQISASQYAVRAQTGASMLQLLTFLEKYGYGLYAYPAPGDITIGGALAIGGHGTGVPYKGEKVPPSQALGTLSNLVISFTAVAWDETENQFILKTFQRSDVEAKAFLVNFGRTFITEVTLLVGLNYNLRCKSTTLVTKDELFSLIPGPNALSTLLDETGRVEIITYPFTSTPWLKIWSIEPTKPLLSREVTQPFNYIFSDNLPKSVTDIIGNMTKGAWALTPLLGTTMLTTTTTGLLATLTGDIWGPSKNLLLYVKPTTLRVTANGYAVITERSNVQRVVSTFNTYYDDLVAACQSAGEYPFNGPVEIRVTSLDNANVVANSEVPSFSAIHPINDHPEYDTVIWFDVLSIPNTPYLNEAMRLLELFMLNEYNGDYASIRPEWSKGWAYTDEGAWTDIDFYRQFVPSTFPSTTNADGWNWAVETLDEYDPNGVFTNSFIDALVKTVPQEIQ
ncbi:uncharacterized protein LOC119074591 [Bradysia coprophila]|uniref:uncharacterized protein LOC119074591 n=1 Tax=Bradysia coprophila TaxID=38358 RepID=UPI00187D8D1E|nr:uncharacterized protein LOC119074591 [Bradysia coprophila]